MKSIKGSVILFAAFIAAPLIAAGIDISSDESILSEFSTNPIGIRGLANRIKRTPVMQRTPKMKALSRRSDSKNNKRSNIKINRKPEPANAMDETTPNQDTTCALEPTVVDSTIIVEFSGNTGEPLPETERAALQNAVLTSYNELLASGCDFPFFREAVAVTILNESGGGANITAPARALKEDSHFSISNRRDLRRLFKRRFTFGVTVRCRGGCPPETTAFTGNVGTKRWLGEHLKGSSTKGKPAEKSAPNQKSGKTTAPNPKASKTAAPTSAPKQTSPNTQCRCTIGIVIPPTETDFTEVFIENVADLQESRELPAELGLPDATIELEQQSCEEESIFESFVTIDVNGDPSNFTSVEIDLMEEIFIQSYNDLNADNCDPNFLRIRNASFVLPDDLPELPGGGTRTLAIQHRRERFLRKIGFRFTASCFDCRGESSVFTGNIGSRYLEESTSLVVDTRRGLQVNVLEDCFCPAFGVVINRPPTVEEFEVAFSETFVEVKTESVLFEDIESISNVTEDNDVILDPSHVPTTVPSLMPSTEPSLMPSVAPSSKPSSHFPSLTPSANPSKAPTFAPTPGSALPSGPSLG
jgi:hypothetical protein